MEAASRVIVVFREWGTLQAGEVKEPWLHDFCHMYTSKGHWPYYEAIIFWNSITYFHVNWLKQDPKDPKVAVP